MEKLKIILTEKEKLISSFNLFNFRDEIVNFMYKKTVADSSRQSLTFYILIFFLSLEANSKSLLQDLFDKNIEKIKALNTLLSKKQRLKKGEYAKLVKQAGLTEIFKYDVFFLLISAVIDSEGILKEFKEFFKKNPEIEKEFQQVIRKYKNTLQDFRNQFSSYLIIDDRWDYRGEYHDLSKSVNRTIRMRTSRHLDLNLHKYAEVKKITSDSPVVVHIIQNIDPEILVKIWESYNLDHYVKDIWDFANNTPLVSGGLLLGAPRGLKLVRKWLNWRLIDGRTNRKDKVKAKENYEKAKEETDASEQQKELLESLTRSVISSNEYLQSEVSRLKVALTELEKSSSILVNREKEIKELKQKIEKLENIDIKVKKEQ